MKVEQIPFFINLIQQNESIYSWQHQNDSRSHLRLQILFSLLCQASFTNINSKYSQTVLRRTHELGRCSRSSWDCLWLLHSQSSHSNSTIRIQLCTIFPQRTILALLPHCLERSIHFISPNTHICLYFITLQQINYPLLLSSDNALLGPNSDRLWQGTLLKHIHYSQTITNKMFILILSFFFKNMYLL